MSTPDPNDNYDKVLTSVRESINKSRDGMKSLEMYLGEEDFIKLAIESSYFFSPSLVKKGLKRLKITFAKNKQKISKILVLVKDARFITFRHDTQLKKTQTELKYKTPTMVV